MSSVRAPGLALVFARNVQVGLEDGWYAPKYGVNSRAGRQRRGRRCGRRKLLTGRCAEPTRHCCAAVADGPGDGARAAVEVERSAVRDTVAWALDGSEATLERSEVGQ